MNPVAIVLAFLGLIVSAHARLNFTMLGLPVSIPVIGIVFAAIMLTLAALVLILLRLLVRDGIRMRSRPVTA